MTTLKEEFLSQYAVRGSHLVSPQVIPLTESEGSGDDSMVEEHFLWKDLQKPHHFSRQHIAKELTALHGIVARLQKTQILAEKDLEALRLNESTTKARLDEASKAAEEAARKASQVTQEQASLLEEVEVVRGRLTLAEERAHQNGRSLVNVTEAVTGMDKVHTSTVQLFEALEGLEDEFSRSTGDLQREVSKFEFNVAQVQAAFDILRHDQSAHQGQLKTLKAESSRLRADWSRDQQRLNSVEAIVTNQSLHRCQEHSREVLRDLKLANAELKLTKTDRQLEEHSHRLDKVHGALMRKVDEGALRNIGDALAQAAMGSLNASEKLADLTARQRAMELEMDMFVRQLPADCSMGSLPTRLQSYSSGVYLIKIPNLGAKEVFCDMTTVDRRWTVIQRRTDGSENFFRDWADYRVGFGTPTGELWLGNEALHQMTSKRNHTLRIDMWDVNDHYIFAEYEDFSVASETDLYSLTVGRHSGNASDSLRHHKSMSFSTRDRDNDVSSTHCAMYYTAGWWYQHCHYVNLNGRYALGMTWYDHESHDWIQLQKVEMKIVADS